MTASRTYPRLEVLDQLSTFTEDENYQFALIVCETHTRTYDLDGPARERIFNDPDGYESIDDTAFTGIASGALRDNRPERATLAVERPWDGLCFGEGGGCTCHPAVPGETDTPMYDDTLEEFPYGDE